MTADLQARAERLLARHKQTEQPADDNDRLWLPHTNTDHPNPLVGTVARFSEASDDYGTHEHIHITELGDNPVTWSVKLKAAALKTQIARNRPTIGQLVAISYQGKKTSDRTGHEYHSFRVTVEDHQELDFAHKPVGKDDDIPF